MRLHLCDLNIEVVGAWREVFSCHPEVDVIHESIIARETDAVVSPANSHGFMDGGIDLVYLRHFGHALQDRVRETICRRPNQIIPVGAAELVDTGNPHIPFFIVAPTMEMPEPVPASHARRAFAAVPRLVDRHSELSDVCCPGLCAGVGRVSPYDAAREMESAYREWKKRGADRVK